MLLDIQSGLDNGMSIVAAISSSNDESLLKKILDPGCCNILRFGVSLRATVFTFNLWI